MFPSKELAVPCDNPKVAAEEAKRYADEPLAVSMWLDRSRLESRITGA